MHRTTVYLPDDLRHELKEVARTQQLSEAEFIRRALRSAVQAGSGRRPRTGVIASGQPDLAERIDEALADFGT